ncbi:unnamed protein product [Schistosoma rodhaini]|uniref:Double zinc ribbon and ankyrin repeat-containing protein 1 n=1 Tax=Schistosoma rodhaini TaxID=6188 RepID=A0AA85F7M5_9TREM|nr:unnamed protein product [Schistosoma rodhaini]
MSAGPVRAPLVIPLRSPDLGLYKSHLDTNTYLDLTCDTPDVAIYFTINGNRPTVAKSRKELQNSGTYKFQKPFTLPPGCHTIRAVAVSLDNGNESSVVTKTFDVVKVKNFHVNDKNDFGDDYGFLNELKLIDSKRRRQLSGADRPDAHESIHRLSEKDNETVRKCSSEKKCPHVIKKSTKDQENHVNLKSESVLSTDNQNNNRSIKSSLIHEYPELSSHMINKLQQTTDILRCPNCQHPRPVSRKQNFCFHCGVNLPILSTPKYGSSALENIGVCPYCKAHVPLNLTSCLVCESPLQMQKYGQRRKESRLCTTCKTMNPTDAKSCIICEARLATGATNVIISGFQSTYDSRPPIPYPEMCKNVRFSTCVYCHRENNLDARYCDWCGSEVPKHYQQSLNSGELKSSDNTNGNRQLFNSNSSDSIRDISSAGFHNSPKDNQNKITLRDGFIHCIKCDLPNPKEANYCSYCGLNLMPPPRCTGWFPIVNGSSRHEFEIDGNQSEKSVSQHKYLQPVVANVSTQTYGIFYPSSTELRRQDQLAQHRLSADVQLRDRIPTLTAISPGRGFWRKQLDHIFAHLKLYTNNNSEFRASIAQPRFGKLLSADLYALASNQAKITLIYSLPNDKNNTSITLNRTGSSKIPLDLDYCDNHNNDVIPHFNKYSNQIKPNSGDFNNDKHEIDLDQKSVDSKSNNKESINLFTTRNDHCESFRPIPNPRSVYNNNNNRSPSRSPRKEDDHQNQNKTRSIEWEDGDGDEVDAECRQNTQLPTKSISSIKTKSNDKSLSIQSNPNVQYGEVGVALLRNSKLSTSDLNLFYTLSQPRLDIHEVKRLLNEGANPNCINAAKETPLICAVRHGFVEAISVLKENGAEINATGTSLAINNSIEKFI